MYIIIFLFLYMFIMGGWGGSWLDIEIFVCYFSLDVGCCIVWCGYVMVVLEYCSCFFFFWKCCELYFVLFNFVLVEYYVNSFVLWFYVFDFVVIFGSRRNLWDLFGWCNLIWFCFCLNLVFRVFFVSSCYFVCVCLFVYFCVIFV